MVETERFAIWHPPGVPTDVKKPTTTLIVPEQRQVLNKSIERMVEEFRWNNGFSAANPSSVPADVNQPTPAPVVPELPQVLDKGIESLVKDFKWNDSIGAAKPGPVPTLRPRIQPVSLYTPPVVTPQRTRTTTPPGKILPFSFFISISIVIFLLIFVLCILSRHPFPPFPLTHPSISPLDSKDG